ncbi:protein tyrosine phosphatase domain-containing protein 1-like [Monomorium pharaonis]|uniref:protein tyrosine phosphatase domain-containing protein 1-like n=1 Tax=Monomorium pharaonis TaxID=307658 RepID=UPI0017477D10|nr:protein tyrosine phosphatase domain-containing protein 1-like [Monomorium pharaonis]
MKNNIYYYNFALKDYGSATVGKLLDMVKVVAFAVQEGRVAIHCHAGKVFVCAYSLEEDTQSVRFEIAG